jgi:hypothetical protein
MAQGVSLEFKPQYSKKKKKRCVVLKFHGGQSCKCLKKLFRWAGMKTELETTALTGYP